MECPQCKKVWPFDSTHAISVELHGACLSCRKEKLTSSSIEEVLREQQIRMKKRLEDS